MVIESRNPLELVRRIFCLEKFTDLLEAVGKGSSRKPDQFYTLRATLRQLKNIEKNLSDDHQGRKQT